MSVEHAWTVVCDKTIIDRETNNISLDSAEQLNVELLPPTGDAPGVMLAARISIASLWYRSPVDQPAKANHRMRVIAPNQETVGQTDAVVDLTEHTRTRTISKLPALPVPKAAFGGGWYYFVIELETNGEWRQVAKVPLEFQIGTPVLPPPTH
jgi:hypothetical protein